MSSLTNRSSGGVIRRTERGTRLAAALVGVFLTICVGYAALLRPGKQLVSMSYDMPFVVHRAGSAGELRIVYIGDLNGDSLDRRSQAQLLEKLGEAGARAVVYDIIFDRKSDDPRVDEEFAAAMRRFRGVDAEGKPIPGMARRYVLLACGRKTITMAGMAGEQLVPPTDILLDAADDFGLAAFDDEAFFVRRLSTGTLDEPSLAWKAAVLLGAPLAESTRLAPRWLNFAGPPPDPGDPYAVQPIPSSSASSVLLGGGYTGYFQDKVVVIGGEPGLVGAELGKDLFSTPFHRFQFGGKLPLMSGVEVQATGLANLLGENWINRTSARSETVLVVLAGLLLGAGLSLLRPLRGIMVAAGVVIAAAVAGYLAIRLGRVWFPWSAVAFAQVPVALVWGVASHAYIERFYRIKISAEQKAIREAFAKYLSPQMLDRLTTEGFATHMNGEKVHAAMMFTDLEGFTDMCERVGDPERIVAILKDYFERTTASIFDHDGVIIKYIGDAIFAAWGAPLVDKDAPIKAVRAAWKLSLNDKLVVDGHEIRTRIGLHTGEVVAGNLGSSRRVDYTLIGDAVNLSARLEGINKLFGTSILMSGEVHAHVNGEFMTRCIGKFRVKGRKEFVVVHELVGPPGSEPSWIALYHQALAALEQNDRAQAQVLFHQVQTARGKRGDGASAYFLGQLAAGVGIEDGVVTLKEK
jgi:adenylate cyclase